MDSSKKKDLNMQNALQRKKELPTSRTGVETSDRTYFVFGLPSHWHEWFLITILF